MMMHKLFDKIMILFNRIVTVYGIESISQKSRSIFYQDIWSDSQKINEKNAS